MNRFYFVFLSMFLVLFSVSIFGQQGINSLDKAFGQKGISSFEIPKASWSNANDLAIRSDGKILVPINSVVSKKYDFKLVRYNSDGSLDYSFGKNGAVESPFEKELLFIRSIKLLNDEKILLGGSYNDSKRKFIVLRYNSDGSLDTSFGKNGFTITSIMDSATGISMAVQADGKIVLGGNVRSSKNKDYFTIVRYNKNGSLDTSFGKAGIVKADFGSIDFLQDLTIQPDGKILAVGTGDASSSNHLLAMIRINFDGSLDKDFGNDGKVATKLEYLGEAGSVDLQSDGKIIVGGQLAGKFTIFRYTTDGSVDFEFNARAIKSGYLGNCSDIVIQPDDKIIAVGNTIISNRQFALFRYNSDGSIDNSFKTLPLKYDNSEGSLQKSFLRKDGSLFVTGSMKNGGSWLATLAKYSKQK